MAIRSPLRSRVTGRSSADRRLASVVRLRFFWKANKLIELSIVYIHVTYCVCVSVIKKEGTEIKGARWFKQKKKQTNWYCNIELSVNKLWHFCKHCKTLAQMDFNSRAKNSDRATQFSRSFSFLQQEQTKESPKAILRGPSSSSSPPNKVPS